METDQPQQVEDNLHQQTIEDQIEAVAPVLDNLFKHAHDNTAVWLKAKDARTLATWIVNMQNVAMLLESQVEALKQKLEEGNNGGSRIWTPGL